MSYIIYRNTEHAFIYTQAKELGHLIIIHRGPQFMHCKKWDWLSTPPPPSPLYPDALSQCVCMCAHKFSPMNFRSPGVCMALSHGDANLASLTVLKNWRATGVHASIQTYCTPKH